MKTYQSLTKELVILPYYHSVSNVPKPHIRNLGYERSMQDFINDLYFISQHYTSVPIQDLKIKTLKPIFHLTFDDGLAEVYTEVLPLLVEKKIHATFFINSDFLDNKHLFYRHKVSVIIEHLPENKNLDLVAALLKIQPQEVISYLHTLKFTDITFIDSIANKININFDKYLQEYQPYLTTAQVKHMIQLGFTIGNHSKSHLNFNSIFFAEQQSQLKETNILLRNVFNIDELYFSFPFGDEHIKNEFFDYMYSNESVQLSFGTAGLKHDGHKQHLHRIPMEHAGYSAENIIKYEYFYYLLKSLFNKNIIKRND